MAAIIDKSEDRSGDADADVEALRNREATAMTVRVTYFTDEEPNGKPRTFRATIGTLDPWVAVFEAFSHFEKYVQGKKYKVLRTAKLISSPYSPPPVIQVEKKPTA